MPILILSDIHANLEALAAVLEDARGKYDRVLCLGDLVGYGAEPNAVTDWARHNCTVVIRGNHDRACAGHYDLDAFNPAARASAKWTRVTLTPENREYLQRLPRGPLPFEGVDLIHGSPSDEDEYLLTIRDAERQKPEIGSRISFFGHTHIQGGFLLTAKNVAGIPPKRTLEMRPDEWYLINPGSVGQPRDGDPTAAYGFYYPDENAFEFRRIAYDVASAAKKILAAGLPPFLAMRLQDGV